MKKLYVTICILCLSLAAIAIIFFCTGKSYLIAIDFDNRQEAIAAASNYLNYRKINATYMDIITRNDSDDFQMLQLYFSLDDYGGNNRVLYVNILQSKLDGSQTIDHSFSK